MGFGTLITINNKVWAPDFEVDKHRILTKGSDSEKNSVFWTLDE